jgi:hypothetical protein
MELISGTKFSQKMSKKIAFNSEYDEAAGNRNLLDHRSTGTSPGENQEPEI